MKALSLWQPWASAIAIGVKRIETRHWPTNYRGPLLIHAAKRKTDVADEIEDLELDLDLTTLPFGALVAVARLVDCRRTDGLAVSDREAMLGNYSTGRFGWILEDIRAFSDPIPYRGAQGLFNVPDDTVRSALEEAEYQRVASL
jgi:activating signal cointegrator 1